MKTPRKCGIFGVHAEAGPWQVNYLTDESVSCGKGANVVISYLHHFFAEYASGETNVHLNADNSAGQNKNNLKLFYLAYRVACGLHKSVHLQFMLAGHTKFSPDWCFGLMDLSPAGRDDQGEVCVETYDWKSFLSSGKKVSLFTSESI